MIFSTVGLGHGEPELVTFAGKFLALGSGILTIIPGTGNVECIEHALLAVDSTALYKPVALREKLKLAVEKTDPWEKILRVDRVELPDEKILWGR